MPIFLSTLSLRRATRGIVGGCRLFDISIHALLAESDFAVWVFLAEHINFYPRSPCGERPLQFGYSWQSTSISIHALLAESDQNAAKGEDKPITFLSTLSLRRATGCRADPPTAGAYFYPRSPCGERHCIAAATFSSITHFYPRSPCGERRPARQQRTSGRHFYPRPPCGERLRCHFSVSSLLNFYPRSPCGERRAGPYTPVPISIFLSTLSLRRATNSTL